MTSRSDASPIPIPPDGPAEPALMTSEDLFGEMIDAPPDPAGDARRAREAPIRVQVAEPKSREVAEQAAADAAAAPTLDVDEMAVLLDMFDAPPSASLAPTAPAAPAEPPLDLERTPPAATAAALDSPAAAPVGDAPHDDDALDALDEMLDALAVPGPPRAAPPPAAEEPRPSAAERGAAPPEPAPPASSALRRPERLPFSDAAAFESLLDALAPEPDPPAAPPEPVGREERTDPAAALPAPAPETRFVARAPGTDAAREELDLLGLAETAFDAGTPAPTHAPEPVLRERPVYGPYQLLERIATGGMAELFRAKRSGVEGFEKIVAVKRILPHLSDNKEFVDMFVDEAKMVAGLAHPNIVQIFDLGRIGRSYFIAMEYVHGRDLRTIVKRAKERGARVPMDLSVLIVSRVCAALEFAHRKKDDRGRPMQIVHRDVSPQNVLISFEGDVKLTDFGIAKAASKASITDRGSLRGKLLYMSPEQASGKSIDRRSDLFALGIVLYELLTGERPFSADSERSILEAVRECRVRPPRALNPRIPDRIEAVVLKALERDPDDRYQDAAELLRDLERVLRERQAPAAPELARLMAVLFEDHEREEQPATPTGEASSPGSGDLDVEFDSAPGARAAPAPPRAPRPDDLSIESLMRRFGIRPGKEA
jgi:serine/threonine protein kinase